MSNELMTEEKITMEEATGLMEQNNNVPFGTNVHNVVFYSMKIPDDQKGKLTIYNYMTKADFELRKCVNKEIAVKDVIAFPVNLRDQNGELFQAIKCNLIDEKGKVYTTCSKGVYNSLVNIFSIVGMPTWDEPIKLMPVEKDVKSGSGWKTLVLEAV